MGDIAGVPRFNLSRDFVLAMTVGNAANILGAGLS